MLTCLFLAFAAHLIRRRSDADHRESLRMKRLRRFSFVELTLFLLVMVMGAAFGLPKLARTVSQNRCETIAKTIQSDLELARRTAVTRGHAVTMQFDWDRAEYQSAEVIAHPGQMGALNVDLTDAFGPQVELSADFDGAAGVRFDPLGKPSMTTHLGEVKNTATITVITNGSAVNLRIWPSMTLVVLANDE